MGPPRKNDVKQGLKSIASYILSISIICEHVWAIRPRYSTYFIRWSTVDFLY